MKDMIPFMSFDSSVSSKLCKSLTSSNNSDLSTLALLHELKICSGRKDLERGRKAHADAVETGADANIYVSNTLISMYSKCGSLQEASRVFHSMRRKDTVSWNALLQAYVDAGEVGAALKLFQRMQAEENITPDARSFVAAIKACSILLGETGGEQENESFLKLEVLEKGRRIHFEATKLGLDLNKFVASSLIDMYSKGGSLVEARRVFDKMAEHDMVSWNSLISGYSKNEEPELAIECFLRMQEEGFVPDARTLVASLKAYSTLAQKDEMMKMKCLETCLAIHAQASRRGTYEDIFLENALIDVYSKLGDLVHSHRVFDQMIHHDEVSWNSLMLGYVESGDEACALELFCRMITEGVQPNARSFVAALKSCSSLALKEKGRRMIDGKLVRVESLEKGMALHSRAVRAGFEMDLFVANTLADMYSKCGAMIDSRRVFDKLLLRKLDKSQLSIPWNSLLLGYAENGEPDTALKLFMQEQSLASEKSFIAALKACGSSGNLPALKIIHRNICRTGLEMREALSSCLVDTYGRAGSMASAQQVFDSMISNPVSWTSLVSGYSNAGDTERVFECFHMMMEEGVEVSAITLVCLLSACARGGELEKGRKCFEAMNRRFGVEPEIEHYHCMVEFLGRENRLGEALELVRGMPHEASVISWMHVLEGCRKWRNLDMGRSAFEELVKVDESGGSGYSVMANLCSG